jgi:hypothetical protein
MQHTLVPARGFRMQNSVVVPRDRTGQILPLGSPQWHANAIRLGRPRPYAPLAQTRRQVVARTPDTSKWLLSLSPTRDGVYSRRL